MKNRSRSSIAVTLLSVAALAASTIPSSARSAAYCRDHLSHMREDRGIGFNPVLILPLAAVGAGVGALVGVAASGIAVGTGAIVGAGSGAGLGVAHGIKYKNSRHYARAYDECRAE